MLVWKYLFGRGREGDEKLHCKNHWFIRFTLRYFADNATSIIRWNQPHLTWKLFNELSRHPNYFEWRFILLVSDDVSYLHYLDFRILRSLINVSGYINISNV